VYTIFFVFIGCKPAAIWMLIRHGSRYPGSDDLETQQKVENFSKILNQTGKATLCNETIKVSFLIFQKTFLV